MATPRSLDYANCWSVSGVRNAEEFFRAIPMLVPEATHMFLEGSPARDVVALIIGEAIPMEYGAPVGTLLSWPTEQRFSISVSPELYALLCEAAAHHAEPEICSHLHFYRDAEPLVHWFDAFADPIVVSKTISRERVERFCIAVGGVLSDTAV